jgi:hypothetical protein
MVFEISSLVLAAWTASLVVRAHWRTRAMKTKHDDGSGYYPLIIRTLGACLRPSAYYVFKPFSHTHAVFTALLLIAFASNIVSAFIGFAAPVPDVRTFLLSHQPQTQY